MNITSKWWLACLFFAIIVGILCNVAQGTPIFGATVTDSLGNTTYSTTANLENIAPNTSSLTGIAESTAKAPSMLQSIWNMFTWNYPFFHDAGSIGNFMLPFMWCLTLAILIPFGIDIIRLIFHPLS